MEGIIQAIEKLSEKSVIDYLLVAVPIIISVLAIIISVKTTRKQNRIALFELRYNCLFQIQTILSFGEAIKDDTDPMLILSLFDLFWGTELATTTDNKRLCWSVLDWVRKPTDNNL